MKNLIFSLHCILFLFFFPGQSPVFLTVNTKYSQSLCQQHQVLSAGTLSLLPCLFLPHSSGWGKAIWGVVHTAEEVSIKQRECLCLYIKCLYPWKRLLLEQKINQPRCAYFHTNIDYAEKLLACKPCFSTILLIAELASYKRLSY